MIHLVAPHTLHDPRHPSGGNRYDLELAQGMRALGHDVREHLVRGTWSHPTDELATYLAALPSRSIVVVDGLVGLVSADVLAAHNGRLRLSLLVHLPLALAEPGSHEGLALSSVDRVITTSAWTRQWLLAAYDLDPGKVHVARPGVHASPLSAESPTGSALLSVGAVVPEKGHDVLVEALAGLVEVPWSCRVIGPLDRAPDFVERLRAQIRDSGLEGRVILEGPLSPASVEAAYATSDLLVLPTRLETYGMVLTEALARGVPVHASDTGGVREAVGTAMDGAVPGVLLPPGDAPALRVALRQWLTDGVWRAELRARAVQRRDTLPGWSATAQRVESALLGAGVNQTRAANVVRA